MEFQTDNAVLRHDSGVRRNYFHHHSQITELEPILGMAFPCSVGLVSDNP